MRRKTATLITAAVMFALGAIAGFFIMRQIVSLHSDLSKYKYVYCVAGGLFLGAALALSAKSAVFVATSAAGAFKEITVGAKRGSIVCVITGVICGALLTWLFDFLIKMVLDRTLIRIIADVAFAVASASLIGVIAFKIAALILMGKRDKKQFREYSGYVLSASALGCDGIYEYCRDWLICPPVVLYGTVSELIATGESGIKALKTYDRLQNEGLIVTVREKRNGSDVAAYAKRHTLKIITANCGEFVYEGAIAFTQIGKSQPKSEVGQSLPTECEQTLGAISNHTVKAIDEL